MHKSFRQIATLVATGFLTRPALPEDAMTPGPIDPARIEQLVRLLPESPAGVGPIIRDRQAWTQVAQAPDFAAIVDQAVPLLTKPIPEWSDEFFAECARVADRKRSGPVLGDRRSRFGILTLAECIENRGRFLPAIETAIRAVCAETTWLQPAHDRDLRNIRKEVIEIDLTASASAWNLATACYWLGDRLSPPTRQLVRDELDRRIFRPFESMVTEGKPRLWWLKTTSNWNAVCLAGVTGTALTAIDDRTRRAFFLAATEKYIQNFMSGFTADGYCSEGLGYWCYGFGNYVKLAEMVYQATAGHMDLLDNPKAELVAHFGRRVEILPGIYPAFADCGVDRQPNTRLMAYLSRRFGMGLKKFEASGLLLASGLITDLPELGIYGFPNAATRRPPATPSSTSQPLRDWFPDAGMLIARPAPDRPHALGAAMKGGHNDEHHNHNDVGTFVVALGKSTPLVDPGAERYGERTFTNRRYESNVLNSYGHSVPRVAGTLQKPGRQYAATVLAADFSDRQDKLVLDIRAAYEVQALRKLHRTFVFSREGPGRLTVIDEVAFDPPQSFGTALITFLDHQQTAPGQLLIGQGSDAVRVDVAVEGGTIRFTSEKIQEDLPTPTLPTRIGIDLQQPTKSATITLTIAPATD
jgi:hypothetical protein